VCVLCVCVCGVCVWCVCGVCVFVCGVCVCVWCVCMCMCGVCVCVWCVCGVCVCVWCVCLCVVCVFVCGVCVCVCFADFDIDLLLHTKEQKPPFVNIVCCNHKTIPHAILSHHPNNEQHSIAQNYFRTTLHGAICRGQLLCCPPPTLPPVIYKPNFPCELSQ